MKDFFSLIFSGVNLPLTILVLLLLLYWLVSMAGGLDNDFEIDADIDGDIDMGVAIESGHSDFEDLTNAEVNQDDLIRNKRRPLNPWQVFLVYFNFIGLPFMFTFSVFIFSWWIILLLATNVIGTANTTLGFICFIAAVIPALIFTKLFTTPFKSFFKKLNKEGDKAIDFIGRTGNSLSNIAGDKMGRAEVLVDGNPMNIYIRSLKGEPIGYNQSILIIKESPDKNFYYAEIYKS